MAARTKPAREPWEKYGQRRHTTYAGAMDQLQAFERDQHTADALRRAAGIPHDQPLAALDSSHTRYAYALHEVCERVQDPKDRPMAVKATLDRWGQPRFSDGVILSMNDAVANRPRQYLTVREVAELRHMSDDAVRDAIICGDLRASRSGGANRGPYRVTRSALRIWAETCGDQPDEVQRILAAAEDMMTREAVA